MSVQSHTGVLKQVPIRNMFKVTPLEALNGVKNSYNILYEDNVSMVVSEQNIILNRYLMELLKPFNKIPITSKFDVTNYYKNGRFSTSTINNIFEVMLRDIVEYYIRPTNDSSLLDKVYEEMYIILNNIYNELVYSKLEYVYGLDILDFIEIQLDKRLLDSIRKVEVELTEESITNTHNVLHKVLIETPELRDNPLVSGYIAGIYRNTQINQSFCPLGFVADLDNKVYTRPIVSSYTLGMANLYELTVESRKGNVALATSTTAVEKGEYLSRKVDMVAMIVEKLIHTDCGNRSTLDWYVKPKDSEYGGDINILLGLHYFDNGVEKIINKNSTHLEGTTIKLRKLGNCKLKNPKHICSACFGDLSYSIFNHTSLGSISAKVPLSEIVRLMLSKKHSIMGSISTKIVASTIASKYFDINRRGDSYILNKRYLTSKTLSVTMIFNQKELFGISDVMRATNMNNINIGCVSTIYTCTICVTNTRTGESTYETFPIKYNNRYGNLSKDMLNYIKEHKYSIDKQDRYCINMDKWETRQPIITLPILDYSYLDMALSLDGIFKSNVKRTTDQLLFQVYNLLSVKLEVNIGILQVIIYAFSARSVKDNDYRICRTGDNIDATNYYNAMLSRTIASGYGFEYVKQGMMDPRSFIKETKETHQMDCILMPDEYLADKKNDRY